MTYKIKGNSNGFVTIWWIKEFVNGLKSLFGQRQAQEASAVSEHVALLNRKRKDNANRAVHIQQMRVTVCQRFWTADLWLDLHSPEHKSYKMVVRTLGFSSRILDNIWGLKPLLSHRVFVVWWTPFVGDICTSSHLKLDNKIYRKHQNNYFVIESWPVIWNMNQNNNQQPQQQILWIVCVCVYECESLWGGEEGKERSMQPEGRCKFLASSSKDILLCRFSYLISYLVRFRARRPGRMKSTGQHMCTPKHMHAASWKTCHDLWKNVQQNSLMGGSASTWCDCIGGSWIHFQHIEVATLKVGFFL